MNSKNAKLLQLILFVLICTTPSCYRVPDKIEPQINYSVQDRYIKRLESAFTPLTYTEAKETWGIEYTIAQKFAKELDLYRAITAFKRAEFLLPHGHEKRLEEIQYQILLSYYLGKRYDEVLLLFNHSTLYHVKESFPPYHDLLVILYESYLETGENEKATYILRIIAHYFPETANNLHLSTALIEGDFPLLTREIEKDPSKAYLQEVISTYESHKKSIPGAQTLNAILPGAGYLYVGQKQSALTAFLLNGLFIAAAYQFFHHNHIAAGIITTSFETGWYFGGIYGAGEAAKLYNERLYEQNAYSTINRNGLFPVLMVQYGF